MLDGANAAVVAAGDGRADTHTGLAHIAGRALLLIVADLGAGAVRRAAAEQGGEGGARQPVPRARRQRKESS